MKFKHKNWTIEDAVEELIYTKYDVFYGYFVLTHDNKIKFFYFVSDLDGISYLDVTNDFEIIN